MFMFILKAFRVDDRIISVFSFKIGDKNGTLCDLREDVPEEVGKLDANAFGYDDDSDLEEDTEELEEVTGKMGTSNLRNQSSQVLFHLFSLVADHAVAEWRMVPSGNDNASH